MDFSFKRSRRRNLPAGQEPYQSQGFMREILFRYDTLVIEKFSPNKPAALIPAQPVLCANEKT